MDLRTLRYFIAVVEAGSLSRAAVNLHIAQPALSAQIKKLEGDLGAMLLERSHVGVTPTLAGVQLYQDARRLLSDADAVRDRLRRLPQGPEGSVTIAIPFLLASLLMGPLLTRLQQTYPRIRVFVLDDLSLMVQKAMLDRRADIGILVDTPQLEGLNCQALASEAMYFCGHDPSGAVRKLLRTPPAPKRKGRRPDVASSEKMPGIERPTIEFSDAAAQPLLLQSRRFAIRQRVEEAAMGCSIRLNVAHEHDSARVIRSLYLCGGGFTFSPACATGDSPATADSDWVVARVVNPELVRGYSLAVIADRPTDGRIEAVLEVLCVVVRELISSGRWEAIPGEVVTHGLRS